MSEALIFRSERGIYVGNEQVVRQKLELLHAADNNLILPIVDFDETCTTYTQEKSNSW